MEKVISVENMRNLDKTTIEKYVASLDLMFKAGKECYQVIKKEIKNIAKKNVLIVCGKGNNAGDGYVIANFLSKERTCKVDILNIVDEFSFDAKYYFDKLSNKNNNLNIYNNINIINFEKYDVIIDCIFGTGFKGKVKEPYRKVIKLLNKSKENVGKQKIVSIDINSGLNGDNGLCDIAVKSDITISIGYFKTGHFLNMAKDYIGKIVNVDIGIIEPQECFYLLAEKDVKKTFVKRKNFSNKGTYGYIALIGGCNKYQGAIKLSILANASMRAGAGVVKIATIDKLIDKMPKELLEPTFYPLSEKDGHIKFVKKEIDDLISNVKSITVGMGIDNTNETVKLMQYLIKNYNGNLIIDADGLNAISIIGTDILCKKKGNIVLTPHIKEFERLWNSGIKLKKESKNIFISKNVKYKNIGIKDIEENLIDYAIIFAKVYNIILLLKGTTTIVTDGKITYLINVGCAGMATAGSGDVLSGIISSKVCDDNNDLLLNVAISAYINGRAGEMAERIYGDVSMIASDTINMIPKVIKNF